MVMCDASQVTDTNVLKMWDLSKKEPRPTLPGKPLSRYVTTFHSWVIWHDLGRWSTLLNCHEATRSADVVTCIMLMVCSLGIGPVRKMRLNSDGTRVALICDQSQGTIEQERAMHCAQSMVSLF